MNKILNFEKEKDGNWYIVLKNWIGPHGALQMVMGADTLLDKLSNNGTKASVMLTDEPSDGDLVCIKDKNTDTTHGRWYDVEDALTGAPVHRMWLCPVTRFVFNGFYPNTITFKNITA